MIFPSTFLSNLLLLILAVVCLGAWINTLKLGDRYRFEFFGYDLAFGVLLAAVVAAFTFGSLNSQELTFQDNFLLTGYRKMAYAGAAGVVYSLGTVLLLAGSAIAGMSVAFPVAFGLGMVIGAIWEKIETHQGSTMLLSTGSAMILGAVIMAIASVVWYAADEAAKNLKPLSADPRAKSAPRRRSPLPGAALAVVSGILMGLYLPLQRAAITGDNGLAAYSYILIFGMGLFGATIIWLPFFMNFPVQGQPVQLRQFVRMPGKNHLLGTLSGIVLGLGLLLPLVSTGSPASAQISPLVVFGAVNAAPILAFLCGILFWGESKGATQRVQMAKIATLVLFLAGVGIITAARRIS